MDYKSKKHNAAFCGTTNVVVFFRTNKYFVDLLCKLFWGNPPGIIPKSAQLIHEHMSFFSMNNYWNKNNDSGLPVHYPKVIFFKKGENTPGFSAVMPAKRNVIPANVMSFRAWPGIFHKRSVPANDSLLTIHYSPFQPFFIPCSIFLVPCSLFIAFSVKLSASPPPPPHSSPSSITASPVLSISCIS